MNLKINTKEWKRLGNRGNNSVLNRDVYYASFQKEYMKKIYDIDFASRNALFIEPALFIHKEEFALFKKKIKEKLKDPGYLQQLVDFYSEYCNDLELFAKKITCNPKQSDKELYGEFTRNIKRFLPLVTLSYFNLNEEEIPNEILDAMLSKLNLSCEKKEHYKSSLLVPLNKKTLLSQEREDLKKIVGKENQESLIKEHIEKYPWINSGYFNVKEVTFEDIKKRLSALENDTNTSIKDTTNTALKVLAELNLSTEDKKTIKLLQELQYLKTLRKELISLFSYQMNPIINELGKRMGISGSDVIHLTLSEIKEHFTEGKKQIGPDKRRAIEKRKKGFAYIVREGKKEIFGEVTYTPEKNNHNLEYTTGKVAYKGKVTGKAQVIRKEEELKNIEPGVILVINNIRPHQTQYLNNIKGIITDHGGILSHAALISREMQIPCIIGTKHATDVFFTGDEIELNADEGHVKKVKKFRKMFGITMGVCRADLYMPTHAFNTPDVIGRGHDDIVFKIKDGKITGFFSEEVIKYMGEVGLNKLSSKEFVENNLKEVETLKEELRSYCEYCNSLPLKHLEIKELLEVYNTLFLKIQKMYGYFNVTQPCISFALENEIDKRMNLQNLSSQAKYDVLNIFLKPDTTTLIEEEEKDLLSIALKLKKNQTLKDLFKKSTDTILREAFVRDTPFFNEILLHEGKYSYLASSENFDMFDRRYYIERLKEAIQKSEKELQEEILAKTPDKEILKKEREKTKQQYSLNEELVFLLNVARIYSHQRMYIRIMWTQGKYVWGKILREFARRLNISEVQIQYVLREEINDFFNNKKELNLEVIKERMDHAIFAVLNRNKPILLSGQQAKEYEKICLPKEVEKGEEVKGLIASKGIQRGIVKILRYGKNMVKQISEMKHGEILVTGNTRPDMIIALKKASAVVTDEGGIMSHAALVSREFGIPCIVGTKDATTVFKDGDLIEVNAEKGIARKLDA